MSLRRKIYQPLPFYSSFEETYYKNKCQACANSFIYNTENLPSFILERDHNFNFSNFSLELLSYRDGSVVENVVTSYRPVITTFKDEDGNLRDQIMFNNPDVEKLPCGTYKIKVTDFGGGNVWYSELYKIEDINVFDLSHNKIEWRNSCPLNEVLYDSYPDFRFGVYLQDITRICEPDYNFTRDVKRNNLAKEVAVLQTFEKSYKLSTGLIPEFLIDALGIMRMSDEVYIYPKGENVEEYNNCVENIETSRPQWDNLGCSSNIDLNFTRDEMPVKTGCCNSTKLICPDTSFVVNKGINESVCWLEDPGTLEVGDAVHVNSDCDPQSVSSNVPCLSIEDGNNHLNEIWVWNGTCFDFLPLKPYITVINNPNNPQLREECSAYFNGIGYFEIPKITLVDTGGGSGDLFVTFIPDDFYVEVSERINDTNGPFDFNGIYTKNQIENGVSINGGSGNKWYYKVEVKNFNCNLGTKIEEITFS